MNKPTTHDLRDWTDAPAPDARPVAGYDAWLAQDIAAGLADLDAGKTVPLSVMRKEFGLE
jgi:hypothetical protein